MRLRQSFKEAAIPVDAIIGGIESIELLDGSKNDRGLQHTTSASAASAWTVYYCVSQLTTEWELSKRQA